MISTETFLVLLFFLSTQWESSLVTSRLYIWNDSPEILQPSHLNDNVVPLNFSRDRIKRLRCVVKLVRKSHELDIELA